MRPSALLLPWLAAAGCAAPEAGYVAEVDAWHAARMAALRSDTGVLTQVGLYPLAPGVQTLGSAPDADIVLSPAAPRALGILALDGAGVTFTADAAATVEVFGREPAVRVRTTPLATDASGPPTVLAAGSLLLHVIERGGEPFLRVRDRASPAPRRLGRIERFPVRERWRVEASLVADGADILVMPNVLGQQTTSPSPGLLAFELDGTALRLRPTVYPDGTLFIVFADATTGTETYAGGRYLRTDPVDADGQVVLDFNRAYIPDCAFNAYSTCPLPPPGNTLPLAVRAGEMKLDRR